MNIFKRLFRRRYNYRHTGTGRFITKAEYDALPRTLTFRERVKDGK